MKNYFSLAKSGDGKAYIDIYGDIRSFSYSGTNVSVANLSKQLEELGDDVHEIHVNINSYGGEVAEGLAIYNALRRHKARIVTHVDGFACSIASVVAMAGDERIMSDASLMMIHNAWSVGSGNASDLRKQADDLDIITEASKAAYLSRASIDIDELTELMDAETWLTPSRALALGFITGIESYDLRTEPSQHARGTVFSALSKMPEGQGGELPGDDPPDSADGDGPGEQDDAKDDTLQMMGRFFMAIS